MQVSKFFLKFLTSAYLHRYPFWFIYGPKLHKVKGYEIREIIQNMREGDLIFRRFNGYLNTFFTPGYWSHVGICEQNCVIHAVGEGVIKEDILDFCRTDSISLLRIRDINVESISEALEIANNYVKDGIEYDWAFKDDNGKVYCTEMVNECYGKLFNDCYSEEYGNSVLVPDRLYYSDKLNTIRVYRH